MHKSLLHRLVKKEESKGWHSMIVHRYNHIRKLPCSPCRWHQSMKDGRVSIEGDAVAYTYVPARCPSFGCNKSSLLCSRPPFMLKRSVPVAVGPRCSCHHGLPCRHRQPSANRIFHRPISPRGDRVDLWKEHQTNIKKKQAGRITRETNDIYWKLPLWQCDWWMGLSVFGMHGR